MNQFEIICRAMGIDPELIKSPCREKYLVDKRKKIAKLLREIGYSYPQIGKMMNRDHSSIIHLVKERK